MPGKYRIEMKGPSPNSKWICTPTNMEMGLAFGKGAMHAYKSLSGGNWSYRLVTGRGDALEIIEEHSTGIIKVNSEPEEKVLVPGELLDLLCEIAWDYVNPNGERFHGVEPVSAARAMKAANDAGVLTRK